MRRDGECRHPSCCSNHPTANKFVPHMRVEMKYSNMFAIVAVLLSSMLVAAQQEQQNPAPPLYPAPNSPAETQAKQNVAEQQKNTDMHVFRVNVYARTAR